MILKKLEVIDKSICTLNERCTLELRITVGAGSKVMAGSVLTVSVPAMSLVSPPASIITERRAASQLDAPAVAAQEAR